LVEAGDEKADQDCNNVTGRFLTYSSLTLFYLIWSAVKTAPASTANTSVILQFVESGNPQLSLPGTLLSVVDQFAQLEFGQPPNCDERPESVANVDL